MKKSSSLPRALLRMFLVPPLFLALLLCLWSASTMLPMHFCVSGFYCLTDAGIDTYINTDTNSNFSVDARAEEKVTSEVLNIPDDGAVSEFVDAAKQDNLPILEVRRTMASIRESAHGPLDVTGDSEQQRSCDGQVAYIYDLPEKFNVDLIRQCGEILPWSNMCRFVQNSGLGMPVSAGEENQILIPAGRWYQTHQYMLEVVFHARLKEYPCLTSDPANASLFYVPFYGGLDVLRWHFRENVTNVQRDSLGHELADWLAGNPWFRRHNGTDHVLALGKISWDFRRYDDTEWGNNVLELPEMKEITKLVIERQPWEPNDIGVPHPTFFHPRTDEEVQQWQSHANGRRRQHLVSFAGSPRPGQQESIRSNLIDNCLSHNGSCFLKICAKELCLEPRVTMEVFLDSHFCMQPPGDSPTRRSLFDSLITGCIPVLFDPYTAYYQYPWHLPRNITQYSIYIPSDDVRAHRVDVVEVLKRIPDSVRQEMHNHIIYEIMPKLIYAQPGNKLRKVKDAFDISLGSLFNRIHNRLHEFSHSAIQ